MFEPPAFPPGEVPPKATERGSLIPDSGVYLIAHFLIRMVLIGYAFRGLFGQHEGKGVVRIHGIKGASVILDYDLRAGIFLIFDGDSDFDRVLHLPKDHLNAHFLDIRLNAEDGFLRDEVFSSEFLDGGIHADKIKIRGFDPVFKNL